MLNLDSILSNPQGLYSSTDIANVFGLSGSSIWDWVNKKKINCTKVGNMWVFKGQDIIDYLDKQQRDGFISVGDVLKSHKLPYER